LDGIRIVPGQYFDEETNNYYNYFRDYDPTTGRYIQSDPIGLAGGLNTYVYALQNPTKNIDPDGLNTIVIPRPFIPALPRFTPKPKPRPQPKPVPDSDYGDSDKDHCIRLYVLCKQRTWSPKGGWKCDKCLNYCTSNGYWPFDKCPAPDADSGTKSYCEYDDSDQPLEPFGDG
jgi:RHS repeat-associated protein